MISPGPAMQDPRRYAATILMQILGDSDGSRLYWSLIEPGLAEEAEAHFDGRDASGEQVVYFACSPEDAEQVRDIAQREIQTLPDHLTDDDLQRVRSKIATSVTLHGERPAGRMRRLGQIWTYRGEYRPLEEELQRINSVTLADLQALYQAFPFSPQVVGRLQPAAG
jgi:predicted Zn-dependent peptidase